MTPRFFSQEHDPNNSRRRLLLALSVSATLLLLLLVPAFHYFSLLGASDDPVIAGDVADSADDDLSEGAGRLSGPANGLASGWSKRSHDSMTVAEARDTSAEAIVTAESFDEWIALQPFRQTSTEDRDSTEESSGDSQSVAPLIAPLLASLSDVFGDPVRADFNLGSGFGFSGVSAGGTATGSGSNLRARRLVVNSTRGDRGTNASDNSDSSAGGSVSSGAGGGNNASGGNNGSSGNNAGTGENASTGTNADGNGGGVGFVPGGDLSGDPADTNVALVVTDPTSTDIGTGSGSLPTSNVPDVPSVPEPTGLVLLGSGLVVAAQSLRTRVARRPKQRLAAP